MKQSSLGLLGFLALAALSACNEPLYIGQNPNKVVGAIKTDKPHPNKGSTTPATGPSLEGCKFESFTSAISGACVYDHDGKTFLVGDSEVEIANTSPFGAAYLFAPGYKPLDSDITVNFPGSAVEVFWAEDYASSPEYDPTSTYVDASAKLNAEGALILTVLGDVPSGNVVMAHLNFGALFKSRLEQADGRKCSLPDSWLCTHAASAGYAANFWLVDESSTKPEPASGSCLLSYNSALVANGADACCYRLGQENTCDTNAECNERSGGGCCLIYGTNNTASGQRCCLYAGGRLGDGADECKELLNSK